MLKKLLTGVGICALAATLACRRTRRRRRPRPAPRRVALALPAVPHVQASPTKEEWDNMNAAGKAYVAKATAEAGNDADLKFDLGVFCQASGGAGNEDRATIGVPVGAPYPAFGAPTPPW